MQAIIGALLRELLKQLDPETVKELVDTLLDRVEDRVNASPNKWDDNTVLPLIETIRHLLAIKDNQYGSDKESA